MGDKRQIIDLDPWLTTPAGRYLLDWEQQALDRLVPDVFGFHAVQLGLPSLKGLRANRMPHRWVFCSTLPPTEAAGKALHGPLTDGQAQWAQVEQGLQPAVLTRFDALPLPAASVDLVLLPHTLDLAEDPHETLREVERVLVPEGRVIILSFNPASLWGLRQRWDRTGMRLGWGQLFVPRAHQSLGPWRLRDWLRLLSFEVDGGHFGCYRPAMQSDKWLGRLRWMESAGDRWWPVLGAVHVLSAVKRVRGIRIIGPAWKSPRKAGARVVATPRMHRSDRSEPARADSP